MQVAFEAAGRTTRFSTPVDSDNGRVRFSRPIPAAQAGRGTGIVTLTYPGDGDTQPQVVRLRAASGQAQLDPARPTITGGRLTGTGEIARRARGVVRAQLIYTTQAGDTRMHEYNARINQGRYRFNQPLPQQVQNEIAARRGVVHSYLLFTGYEAARMRGEMRSYQVLGDR